MRSNKKLIAIGAFACFIGLGCAPARAHARLVSANPAVGSIVADSPAEIALTFSEAVKPIVFKIADKDGKDISGGRTARIDGMTLHIPVAMSLAQGQYTVSYRIAGDDGHVVTGSMTFSVQPSKP